MIQTHIFPFKIGCNTEGTKCRFQSKIWRVEISNVKQNSMSISVQDLVASHELYVKFKKEQNRYQKQY